MDILIFAVKRFFSALVVLVAVSILTFLIFFAIPNGDPALRLAGRTATAADIAAVRHTYGFDRPIYVQYWRTMHQILDGKIESYTQHVTVFSQIKRGLPATLSLAIGAAIIWMVVGIVFGMIGALKAGKAADVTITTVSFIGISAPSFVVGGDPAVLLQLQVPDLPRSATRGSRVSPWRWFEHLVLPWITLAILYIGIYAQVLRSSVLDAMTTDAVRTARAKGLSPTRVLLKHILRVSLIPIVSLWGLDFAAVIGGSPWSWRSCSTSTASASTRRSRSRARRPARPRRHPAGSVLRGHDECRRRRRSTPCSIRASGRDRHDRDPRRSSPSRTSRVSFRTEGGTVHAVDDVSFSLNRGEVLSIVGESGSGKSVSAMTLMGLTRSPNATIGGSARLADGTDLITASDRQLQHIRGSRVSMIFQDPMSALTPVYRVGDQIVEQIRAHEKVSKQAANDRAIRLLERVGIPRAAERARRLPAPVLRWHAAARHDRHGAVVLAGDPHRR